MINLLASGLILAFATVAPASSSDCVGATVAPAISTTVCPLAVVPTGIPAPTAIPSMLPTVTLPPLPSPIKLPPVLVVPTKPPAYTPPPYQPPAYQPPVYQPPVYTYIPPAPQPAPDVTPAPVHVQQLPSPTTHPTPAAHPTAEPVQLLKHLKATTPKSPVSVVQPDDSVHRQPPFDNSVAGTIGNTVAQFPDFGWVFLILAGLGIIVLNEKLDKKPNVKPVGRHSAKLK